MKKKIALLLAVVMTMSMLPMNLFASSKNTITSAPGTVPANTAFVQTINNSTLSVVRDLGESKYLVNTPYLRIVLDDAIPSGAAINGNLKLLLSNARWFFRQAGVSTKDAANITRITTPESGGTGGNLIGSFLRENATFDTALGSYISYSFGGNSALTDSRSGTYSNYIDFTTPPAYGDVYFDLFISNVDDKEATLTILGYWNPIEIGVVGNPGYIAYGFHAVNAGAIPATVPTSVTAGVVTSTRATEILVPLVSRTTSETSPSQVTIDNSNLTQVSRQTLSFGEASAVATKASVGDPQTARREFSLDKLIVRETRINTLVNGRWFEIIAPHGFEFADNLSNVKAYAEPGLKFSGVSQNEPASNANIWSGSQSGSFSLVYKRINVYGSTGDIDTSVIQVIFNGLERSSQLAGLVYFTGLSLVADNDAPWGDIMLQIRNVDQDNKLVTEESFKAGTRQDWKIELKTLEDPKELVNGRYIESSSPDAEDFYHLAAKVSFKELAVAAWWAERETIFTLPEWAKIRKLKITKSDELASGGLKTPNAGGADVGSITGATSYAKEDFGTVYYPNDGKLYNKAVTVDANTFTFENIKVNANKKAVIELQLWLSIESGYEGDVTLACSTPYNDIESIVIAKAINPVSVKTKVTDVKIGLQYQEVADIEITETKAGALLKNKDLRITLTDEIYSDIYFTQGSKVSVSSGDLKYKDLKVSGGGYAIKSGGNLTTGSGTISLTISSASTKASTILYENLQVKIDRAVPETNKIPYEVVAWGTAIAENYGHKTDMFQTPGIKTPYLRVVTSSDVVGNTLAKYVKVTIGDPVIQIGNSTYTMDTAAYISPVSNSTMVPVRFIAVALGISDEQVTWDPEAQTVTVRNANSIVQFTIGSAQININGVITTMLSPDGLPVPAEIRDDRSFVSMRWVANAFGIPVAWDPETQSAIYNEYMK